ncbi:DUF3244 domain-containing protein [Parabacteroides sp. AF48-14]|uniref:DUF3244 domain-containing protein n=1 Tax=Parabacteroides sp. AF48-14 TaxID=2292052 RepID=UPI000EFF667E|nr:DUF3244 domain-containing protein [Parabacteroides sp. AF48-14]RHO63792.1 DUF3244 domain-containing protein [Parabacteroides sp. AF48-14]
MKRISFLFLITAWVLTFVSPSLLSAKVTDTRDIELRAKYGDKDLRSLLPVRAWIDNQTVYVSFLDSPETATVIITNGENGESVTTSFSSLKTVLITLGDKGKYRIEINYGTEVFEGNFNIK